MPDLTEQIEPAAESAAEANGYAAASEPAESLSPLADESSGLASDCPVPRQSAEKLAAGEPGPSQSGSHQSPQTPEPLAAVAAAAKNEAKSAGPPKKPPPEAESWVETVKTIAYALLIALVIRTFLLQPFNIPSGSMENTLLIGDYLFVEKFAYGYSRYSFPFGFPPFRGRVFGAEPQRGDVIVFKMPKSDSPDYMKDFIKRVIGLPGDRVQVINGQVWLNGKPVPRVRAGDAAVSDEYGVSKKVERYRETLPTGKGYFVLGHDVVDAGDEVTNYLQRYRGDNTQVYVVPPGHYFMMGDNRENSADSRFEVGGFGFVPAQDLEGKAEFIFFSVDGDAPVWEFWKWPWEIRYNRIFSLID